MKKQKTFCGEFSGLSQEQVWREASCLGGAHVGAEPRGGGGLGETRQASALQPSGKGSHVSDVTFSIFYMVKYSQGQAQGFGQGKRGPFTFLGNRP